MKIKTGQRLKIQSIRKGSFKAVAIADFDTKKDDFAEVALDQSKPLIGMSEIWEQGDRVPLRCAGTTFSLR